MNDKKTISIIYLKRFIERRTNTQETDTPMEIGTTKLNLWIKASLLMLAVVLTISPGQISFTGFNAKAQQVSLDTHSAANGLSNWTITTHYPNELIIISAGGYGTGGNTLHTTPGVVTVNGNNATYITRGEWLNASFTWVCEVWAYVAPIAGVYSCVCTEQTLNQTYYLNFASSVYQPNCPIGLNLGNIIKGGADSNHGPTTVSASITTTENGAWIYGTIDNNDNGGTGKVAWNNQLTPLNYTYSLGDGVDGAQADSTYANAGTYNITSTDVGASNVWMTMVLIAVQPNPSCCALNASASAIHEEKCCGDKIGSAYGIPSKGHNPYTYLWTPGGQITDSVSGLSAGTYSIVISDTIGCSATATVNITQPALLTATPTVSNVLCNGGTGSAKVTAAGGTSPYTYLWTPTSQTTASATGLSIGTYAVSITDSNGCAATASVSITQPTALTASIATPTYPVCYGQTGSAVSSGIGGTSPYTYSWSPIGGTNATGTGLTVGTYTVTVKDNNGCTATANTVITQPTIVAGAITATTYPVCNGQTGSATVKATGGVPGYKYLWAPSAQTTTLATGLFAGVYTVTITDASGCTGTVTASITQPTQVVATIANITNPPCNGNLGSATVSASGGVSQYTYKWRPSNQTTATATGLVAGIYTVTVSDGSGCTGTTTATLTQPAVLTATISATNYPICNGGTGNATVTAAGGTIPYTYLWAPGTQTTAAATGLTAGAYTIKVTDVQGCTATNTVTITQPVPLTITMGTPTYIFCYGEKSNVTVAASGGTNPYTYLWAPSAETTALATGLSAGTYTVGIIDAHHCTGTATVTITQPTLVTAAITSTTGISCINGNNGTATAKGAGGVPPYAYLWTPSTETTATATGLFAVSYTVTITDANGCTATATSTLTQPTQVTASISEPKIICKDSTGILIANPGGGTPGYKYAWSSGATVGTATVTPTFTNDYSVTVTDANGCTATANIALQYGASFAVDIGGRKSVCLGDSTTLCANTIGAIDGVVKYMWDPVNNSTECVNVTPTSVSVYTLTVVDGCGSTTTASATVYTEPIPTVNMGVDFSGGCLPFCVQFLNSSTVAKGNIAQYIWSFGDGDSTHTKQPVYCYKTSGNYSVSLTVISDSGCSASLKRTSMINVYSSPRAAFTYSPQPVTILTPTIQFIDESTDAYGIGYRWWSFGGGSDSVSNLQNPIHTYTDTGTYCATLIEMNNRGCMDTVTNCLVIEPAFNLYIPSAFTPNGDGKNEVFKPMGQYVKSFEMYVFDRWGMELFHSTNINQGWNGTVNGAGTVCQEDVYIYRIIVTDSEGNQHSYVGNVTLMK